MRCRAIAFVFLALNGATAGLAKAQAQCTYDRCALRLDRKVLNFFGNETLRVGLDGAEMRLGFSGDVLTAAVAGVPEALRSAEQGSIARERGNIALLVGSLVMTAALSQLGTGIDDTFISPRSLVLAGAGAGVSIYGSVQLSRGSQAFSRAVWLFNRALPR